MSDIERSRGSLPQRVSGERAVVPEGAESLKRVMDQIQGVLVGAYGLGDLNLLKASQFTYPEVTSQMAVHNLSVETWENGGFFVTDKDTEEGIKQSVDRLLLRQQAFRESIGLPRNPYIDQNLGIRQSEGKELTEAPRSRFRLPIPWVRRQDPNATREPNDVRKEQFVGLKPVIYIFPEIIAKTKGVQRFSEMVTQEAFRALDVITEETGHFLYTQVQYILYGETPGHIVSEGMALVDNYEVLKQALEERGQSIFDPSDSFVRGVVGEFVRKISERGEMAHKIFRAGGYNSTASQYTKSVEVMSGFVKHLVAMDAARDDTQEELRDFYRMSGPQKGRYLRELYGDYVRGGDATYQNPLEHVTDRVKYEIEFEDEGLWREKWERVKDSPLEGLVDPF